MLLLVLSLGLHQQPSLDTLTALAGKKDIAGLAKFSTGDGSEYKVLHGGAYDVGRFGWKAEALNLAGAGSFVVLTTPLTSEDIGELLFERVGSKLKFIDEQEKDGLRLNHHKVRAAFDVAKKEAVLTDEISATVTANDKKFHALRFSPCYKVNSVTDGTKAVPYKQTGGILMIPKQKPGSLKLFISYRAIVDLPNYAGSITPSVITLTNDYWYPMVNRMPSTYDITVVPPDKSWTVVAQGDYQGTETGQKQPGEKFKVTMPTIYWSLTVLKTKHVSEKIDGRMLQMWSPRVPEERMKLQPKLYAPIIKLFNDSFSPFPFDSYGALDSPTYGGGALEAYSYATYGGGLPAEDAHEPSHTWWGGIMPNTYLRSFWNESFANWSVGYFAREVSIGNRAERRDMFQTVAMPEEDYNEAPLMKSGASIGAAASSLGYGKGALVLAMLEQLVGTDNLLACLQDWIKGHPKGEPAEWEQFESVVLKKLPQFELKDFFDDWFRRPGFANVSLASGSMNGGKFSGKLAWNGPKFRMPLDIWFEDAAGNRTKKMLDTKQVNAQGIFNLDGITSKPVRAYFDPFHRALRVGTPPDCQTFSAAQQRFKVVRDSKHPEYMQPLGTNGVPASESVENRMLIGHPDTMPQLKPLLAKVGFVVDGDNLTYMGTTVDLKKGGAVAVVNLDGGKQCAIALGAIQMPPNIGLGSVGLVDELGRALRGKVKFPVNAGSGLVL